MGAHLIEEVAVVGDDDHRAFTFVEHVLQPADGVDIEVIGRFIQQQDVRIGKQCLREQHAQLPAGGNGTHRAKMLFGGDAHAMQQLAGARLRRVAVELGKLRLQLGSVQVILLAGLRIGVDRILLAHAVPHLLVALQHHIQHPLLLVGKLILLEESHAFVGIERDIAGRRLQAARQDFHQRRLARAIRPDQAIAVALPELDRNILKQRLGPELYGDVRSNEHEKILSSGSRGVILPEPAQPQKTGSDHVFAFFCPAPLVIPAGRIARVKQPWQTD